MTQYEKLRYGDMKIQRRIFGTEKFPVWNAVQECEQENCVAAHVCPYQLELPNPSTSRKCLIVLKYLKEVETMVLNNFGKSMSDPDLFRVGMHLVPLYKQLARLKIIEMATASTAIAEMTKSGTTKINCIFREIRECVKAIDLSWKELGMMANRVVPGAPEIPMNADASYYERMEKDALKEQKKLKVVRQNGSTR